MIPVQSSDLADILIESTGFCNAKCPHCPRYTDDGFLHDYIPETHLTVGALEHGLNPAELGNLKIVRFSGATGDPLMNPHIEQLVEFFNFVPKVTIDTNGSLRSVSWWQQLARFNNLTVIWSIDGLKDTNHLYRVSTDFDTIIENAQAYIRAGGRALWKCIVFKHNEHQLNEIKNLAKKIGFVGVQFIRAFDYRFQEQKEFPVMVQGQYLHSIQPGTYDQHTLDLMSTATDYITPTGTHLDVLCPMLRNRLIYINVLGQVLPCCMMTHETTNDYPGTWAFKQLVNNDFNNISLYHYTLNHILENFYADEFEIKLSNPVTRLTVCDKSCSGLISGNQQTFTGLRVPTKHESNN